MAASQKLTKRATIRRKFFDEWTTLGTLTSNWDGDATHKARTVIWMGAWVGGQVVAFPEEGVPHPYVEGFLCARLIEGKDGEDDYYQRVGFISTKLKPGTDGPDTDVDRYHIRLDCFPITQRQLSLKSQVGLYLSVQEIEPVPGDGPDKAAAKGKPPVATHPPADEPRAVRACRDFEQAFGLCQEDLELIINLDVPKWDDESFSKLRDLFHELEHMTTDERVAKVAELMEIKPDA